MAKMPCPNCNHSTTKCTETRAERHKITGENVLRRQRACDACSFYFWTQEEFMGKGSWKKEHTAVGAKKGTG